MSRRPSLLLVSFLVIMLANAGLLGVLIYGPELNVARGERLGLFSLPHASPLDSDVAGLSPSETADRVSDAADPQSAHLALELQMLREEVAELTMSNSLIAEKAAREIDVLRLKLKNAERAADDAERKVAASRSRIAALEREMGLSGDADAIVDAVGQPLVTSPTPEHLGRLGAELRLVQRERDGARAQLDRALERIAEFEEASSSADTAEANNPFDRHRSSLAEEIQLLKNANVDLSAALEAHHAQAAVERTVGDSIREDLESRLSALSAANLDYKEQIEQLKDDFAEERDMLTAAITAAKARIAALETDAHLLTNDINARHEAAMDELQARISALVAEQTRLSNERDALSVAVAIAEAENAVLEAEIARLAAALDAERVGRAAPSAQPSARSNDNTMHIRHEE